MTSPVEVSAHMEPPETRPPMDRGPVPLWIAIRNRRIDFNAYARFINLALCEHPMQMSQPPEHAHFKAQMATIRADQPPNIAASRSLVAPPHDCLKLGWLGHGMNAYELLKTATEVFLLLECGAFIARYRDPAQAATPTPGAVPEPLQRFARQALARALADPHLLDRTLGEWLTEPKDQVWFAAGTGQNIARGVQLDRRSRMAYDARHVFINGESHRASGRDARLMRTLADQRRLDARALAAASPDARSMLEEWLASGWLHPST